LAFVLGLVMFLPSPLYILVVKDIADGHASTPSDVLAGLICAIAVTLLVEIPLRSGCGLGANCPVCSGRVRDAVRRRGSRNARRSSS
jgi:hypothetical protein